jgi:hypothetical protein
MKLPFGNKTYDILTPRIPFLRNLPEVLWSNQDMLAVRVHYNSQKSLRKAAEILGCYFRRENKYDFPPYGVEDHIDDNLQLILLLNRQYQYSYFALGCIGFDYGQKYSSIAVCWHLSWAWFHPFCRGAGYLSQLYPSLLRAYGDFIFQPPLSKTMKHVAFKCGSERQKEMLRDFGWEE